MKRSNIYKAGIVLVVMFLLIGLFVSMTSAQGNGYAGGNNSSQGNAGPSDEGLHQFSEDAPDTDGDGIPNGQDEDSVPVCDDCWLDADGDGMPNCQDEDYDGDCTCVYEPQRNGWGKWDRNASDEEE